MPAGPTGTWREVWRSSAMGTWNRCAVSFKAVLVRPKTLSKRGATDYLGITLHKAAARQASKGVYRLPKVRNSTPNSREGRPLSAVTVAVLTMHAARPELRLVAIAAQLGIDP